MSFGHFFRAQTFIKEADFQKKPAFLFILTNSPSVPDSN